MTILRAGFGSRSAAFEIEKSLRFRAAAGAYLQRTLADGNRKTLTVSFWMKIGSLGTNGVILGYYQSSSNHQFLIRLLSTGELSLLNVQSGSINLGKVTTQLFRDPSAWYHVCAVYDTTQAVADDRVKLFINGVQITSFSANTNPAQNADLMINFSGQPLGIGRERPSNSGSYAYFDGYLSEFNFVDGQALTAADFGEFSPITGQWIPKAYTGSYGTNGFYLPFTDGISLTTLGYDGSGNNNDWTLNNISLTAGVTYDWMDDTPSNNFATLNPLQGAQGTIANANCNLTSTSNSWQTRAGSFVVSTGKWYWEVTVVKGGNYIALGIDAPDRLYTAGEYCGDSATGYGYMSNAQKFTSASGSAYGASYTTNDIMGVALDLDSGELTFYKNGVTQGVAFTGLTGEFVPAFGVRDNTLAVAVNFGQRPFAYTPPAGFKALSTANLPAPTVADGSDYFDVVLDSGANIKTASEALFGNFFEWIKDRANANNHQLIDSVRGNTAVLQSNTTGDETTYTAPSGNSVGWVWRIAAGFMDVVTYTGTGVARTIAHNLGVAPAMVAVKARTTAGGDQGWPVYHKANTAAPETDYLLLNTTAATADLDTVWNDTAPTSSVFSVGTNALVNTLNDTYVAYLFAEVEGFSKFGAYTGNGSANGPFVWCGFKPKFLMIKRTNGAASWHILDTARGTTNVVSTGLYANLPDTEYDLAALYIDVVSNGFKPRGNSSNTNTSGGTYIFAAFAESPFKHATAR